MKCPKCGGEMEEGMLAVIGGDVIAGLDWYPELTRDIIQEPPGLLGRKSIRIRGPTYRKMTFCHRCPKCEALFIKYEKAEKNEDDQ